MRNFRTEGIIVKRHNLGEADRIITVFTPQFGKISIKAAGVRKITSKRSAHIELLNQSILSLYKGSGMYVLTEVKMIEDFQDLKKDFNKIGLAYHLCELVDCLCPENQENYAVFSLLKKTLLQIAQKEEVMFVNTATDFDEYTLGTFGIGLRDEPQRQYRQAETSLSSRDIVQQFEIKLLTALGYWDKSASVTSEIDTQSLIESIIERRLKARQVFSKLQ